MMILKRLVLTLVSAIMLLSSFSVLADERLKPFVLAASTNESPAALASAATLQLEGAGYTVVATYSPYDNAVVLVFTSPRLQSIASKTELGGFGAVLRAAATTVDGQTQLSYVNPTYLAQAYRLDEDLVDVATELQELFGAVETFGSRRGLKPKSLRSYHYMLGMEYFDDTYELGEFDSQGDAVAAVERGLAENALGLSQVYQLALPDQDAMLFGVAMAPMGEAEKYFNDAYQMSVVDFGELRSTAYLPYEVLVKDGKVRALHMRFRMAVHFPDLSMMGKHSFMTLMPSPEAIHDALKSLVNSGAQ